MSGTTESLRRQIAGAGDLESVVRSMKALAASSIGQYETAVKALDGYFRTVELGLAACLRGVPPAPPGTDQHPRPGEAVGVIVFGSDQGLVGRFNEVVLEFITQALAALPEKRRKVWAIGERIHALLADSGLPQASLLQVPASVHAITPLVGQILIAVEAARNRGEIGDVYLFHNHPKGGAVYAPVCVRLLPLDQAWRSLQVALPWPTKMLPQVIGGDTTALPAFIRGYLFVLLFQACAESLTSENASRLAAMQRAERNIKDLLETLKRRFHSLRQESIDEELFDVISAFEAQTGEQHIPRLILAG